jgi:hypothetical protein
MSYVSERVMMLDCRQPLPHGRGSGRSRERQRAVSHSHRIPRSRHQARRIFDLLLACEPPGRHLHLAAQAD